MLLGKGFTIIELLLTLCIMMSLTLFIAPSFTYFIAKIRVDNEISELHHLLLLSRNTAVTSGKKVTLCPLNESNKCTPDWQDKLAVFIDTNNNKTFDALSGDILIQVKNNITIGDTLLYGLTRKSIIYSPSGHLSGLSNGTFRYCPKGYPQLSRGLIVARSGRVYQSNNKNSASIDKNRSNKVMSCQ